MKNELSCEVVQDLLPSYVDCLTSDVTNQSIETHIQNCTSCREILNRMKHPEISEIKMQNHDIDFFKKVRAKARLQTLFFAIITVIAVIAAVLINAFFIGKKVNNPSLVQIDATVKNFHIMLKGNLTDPGKGISAVKFDNKNGSIHVTVLETKRSNFNKNYFKADYNSNNAISQVWLGDRILWDNGENISDGVSQLYKTKHPYIGNMPQNEDSALALGIWKAIGTYSNELQTKEEPYGWKLIMKQDYASMEKTQIESKMKSYASALISVIDNLDYVTFEYTVDGEKHLLTFTEQDADKLAGHSVKNLAETPRGLQELMKILNLSAGYL